MRNKCGLTTILAAGVLGLSGCFSLDIEAPAAQGMTCNFVQHELSVTDSTVDPAIETALASAPTAPLLFLSGGSQSGAFGAGYLQGWAERDGSLPEFAIVTGVSTGALLSLAAFTNNADVAAEAYEIESEGDVLTLFVKNKNDELSLGDYVSTVKAGAVADLIPMRRRLRDTIDNHDLIKEISDRGGQGRKLFAIATDLDSGYARAFDMTEMAQRIHTASSPADQEKYKACFIEGLVASSSVPMAAKPVFIDDTMYVDGGARFGAMSHRIGLVAPRVIVPQGAAKRDVYVIFNGDQTVKDDCDICGAADDASGRHKNWNLPALAGRSISILIDQIYQFSEDKINRDSADAEFNTPQIVKIEPGLDNFEAEIDGVSRTCEEWKAVDNSAENPPLEFHPNYMRCMIAYGENRANPDP